MKHLILFFSILIGTSVYAVDSTRIDTSYHHNRKKAALFSTFLPGMGQIYNEFGHRKVQGLAHRSWWRAPLYLSGLVFTGYLAHVNGSEATRLRKEWEFRSNNEGQFWHGEYESYSDDNLLYATKTSNGFNGFVNRSKYRDYAVVGFILIYGLNVVDSFVDSHFVTFDVSQNLTLSFQPKMYSPREYGVGLRFNFN